MTNVVGLPGTRMPREFDEMRASLDLEIAAQLARIRALYNATLKACMRNRRVHTVAPVDDTTLMSDEVVVRLIVRELQRRGGVT